MLVEPADRGRLAICDSETNKVQIVIQQVTGGP
jgi:hypothetical protein